MLAGSADVCAMTLALSIVLAAARLAAGRRRARALPALVSCLAALALAAALSCPLWLPAVDLLSRSARRGLPEDVRETWSLPATGLARLVAPLDPRRVPFDPEAWKRLYDRPGHPFLASAYLGMPVLGLACLALFDRRRRSRAVLLALVALGAIVLAMGPHGPIYRPLAVLVPGVASLRYPSKALLMASLVIPLLAGLGVRALARAGRARTAAAALVLAGAGAGVLAARQFHATVGWAPLLAVAFALALSLRGTRLRAGFGPLVLVALACLDLLAAHTQLNATAPVGLLEPPPVVALLRRNDGQRIHVWDYYTQPDVAEQLLGRRDPYRPAIPPAPGVDARAWEAAAQRQVLVPPSATFFGLETSYDFDSRGLYASDMHDLSFLLRRFEGVPVIQTRLLQLGAVSQVVALHARGLETLRLEHELPTLVGDSLRVFAVPDALPRARLVGQDARRRPWRRDRRAARSRLRPAGRGDRRLGTSAARRRAARRLGAMARASPRPPAARNAGKARGAARARGRLRPRVARERRRGGCRARARPTSRFAPSACPRGNTSSSCATGRRLSSRALASRSGPAWSRPRCSSRAAGPPGGGRPPSGPPCPRRAGRARPRVP